MAKAGSVIIVATSETHSTPAWRSSRAPSCEKKGEAGPISTNVRRGTRSQSPRSPFVANYRIVDHSYKIGFDALCKQFFNLLFQQGGLDFHEAAAGQCFLGEAFVKQFSPILLERTRDIGRYGRHCSQRSAAESTVAASPKESLDRAAVMDPPRPGLHGSLSWPARRGPLESAAQPTQADSPCPGYR